MPEKLYSEASLHQNTSRSLRVACASMLFQNSFEEKLLRERTGHRLNAEISNGNVSKIQGPPQSLSKNDKTKEYVTETNEMDSLFRS